MEEKSLRAVSEWGLPAPLVLPPGVFHGFMAYALDGEPTQKKGDVSPPS